MRICGGKSTSMADPSPPNLRASISPGSRRPTDAAFACTVYKRHSLSLLAAAAAAAAAAAFPLQEAAAAAADDDDDNVDDDDAHNQSFHFSRTTFLHDASNAGRRTAPNPVHRGEMNGTGLQSAFARAWSPISEPFRRIFAYCICLNATRIKPARG